MVIDVNTTLSELEPYITGKAFLEGEKTVTRLDRDSFLHFMEMLNNDPIAKQFFDAYEHHLDFYTTAVDFKNLVPKDIQAECFYAAKLGKYYYGVPSVLVYMVQKAYESVGNIPNLIIKALPTNLLRDCFTPGYLAKPTTLRDVICNVCCEQYTPLCELQPKNRVNDEFTELYIKSTNMVAAVPNRIADALDANSILSIEETPSGLAVGGILLRTMCDYVGAINSVYDLRALI